MEAGVDEEEGGQKFEGELVEDLDEDLGGLSDSLRGMEGWEEGRADFIG